MKEILIVNNALETIKDECKKGKQFNIETGGSLLGFRYNNKNVILYALRTGDNANQSYGGITTDSMFQNDILETIIDYYPNIKGKLDYLADWHLHPMFYPKLSSIDHEQCFEILNDKDYNLKELPIILVTFDNSNKMILCPFIVSLDEKNKIIIEKAKLVTISSDSKIIKDFLNSDYVCVDAFCKLIEFKKSIEEDILATIFKRGFFTTEFGKSLLDKENFELLKLTQREPQLSYLEEGRIPCLDFEYKNIRFKSLFPPEFPFNSPTILFTKGNIDDFEEVETNIQWNSLCSVANIVKDFLEHNNYD